MHISSTCWVSSMTKPFTPFISFNPCNLELVSECSLTLQHRKLSSERVNNLPSVTQQETVSNGIQPRQLGCRIRTPIPNTKHTHVQITVQTQRHTYGYPMRHANHCREPQRQTVCVSTDFPGTRTYKDTTGNRFGQQLCVQNTATHTHAPPRLKGNYLEG